VRTSPLGTPASSGPTVPAPDNRRVWSIRWNVNWQGKPKHSENTCPSATLSTTNPTWPDLGSNPGRRGGKPSTNRLSYGMAVLRLSTGWNNVSETTGETVTMKFNLKWALITVQDDLRFNLKHFIPTEWGNLWTAGPIKSRVIRST
jgi:hypothetical protein